MKKLILRLGENLISKKFLKILTYLLVIISLLLGVINSDELIALINML